MYGEGDEFMADYYSSEGRLNRWPYFLKFVGCLIVSLIPVILLIVANYIISYFHIPIDLDIFFIYGYILFCLILLLIGLYMLLLSVKRLHDLDKSGWYLLIRLANFIPYIGWVIVLVFDLYLFLAKGTTGPNRFGPDPLRGEAGDSNYPAQSLNSEVVDAEYEEDMKQK